MTITAERPWARPDISPEQQAEYDLAVAAYRKKIQEAEKAADDRRKAGEEEEAERWRKEVAEKQAKLKKFLAKWNAVPAPAKKPAKTPAQPAPVLTQSSGSGSTISLAAWALLGVLGFMLFKAKK